MERLTKSNDNGMAWYKSDLLLLEPCELSYSQVGKVLRRLAAYEDTGMTPEEIKVLKDTTALRICATFTEAQLEELREKLKQARDALCVCCGEYVPEGRQVCPTCETEAGL